MQRMPRPLTLRFAFGLASLLALAACSDVPDHVPAPPPAGTGGASAGAGGAKAGSGGASGAAGKASGGSGGAAGQAKEPDAAGSGGEEASDQDAGL